MKARACRILSIRDSHARAEREHDYDERNKAPPPAGSPGRNLFDNAQLLRRGTRVAGWSRPGPHRLNSSMHRIT